MTDDSRWIDFRRQMPVARNWAYFDHAAVAPISLPAHEALREFSDEALEQGNTVWKRWAGRVEQVRRLAAEMIGATPAEIALVPNTTAGIGLVAEGFPWQPGDNVVTLADEFPSNLYPWMNLASRGVETRRVPTDNGRVDLDRLAAACDARTRIVSISWVGFASGWRNNVDAVARIAHERGTLFFLDAIQGLGAFLLDVKETNVDFLAADGHKWMLGPEGAGLLYVKREHLNLLRPLNVGWHSVVHSGDYSRIELALRDTAARYEGGSQNMAGFLALGASLELLSKLGIAAIGERILELTAFACQRLKEIGAVIASHREMREHCSGIVSFEFPGQDPQALRLKCLDQKVVLGCRNGRLRISPHAYCNEEDIKRLIAALS